MYKVPMIFPGQASQSVGMAQDLAAAGGAAGGFLARIDDILGDELTRIMFEGPSDVLTETRNAQPAILAHSVAVTLALREMGIVPSLVAGHSLGEFSAAVAAGALEAQDALRIVRRRGELMFASGQEVPGTMAAVMGLTGERVNEICRQVSAKRGVVVLANQNSENQVAISGEIEAVAAASEALSAAGAKRVTPLNVSGAFHSPLLAGAGREFGEFLGGIPVADAQVPLVANVTAIPVTASAELKQGFISQLTSPVLWHDIMNRIAGDAEQVPPVVLEVGPGKVLTGLARRAFPSTKFLPVGTVDDLTRVLETLANP